MKHTSTLVGILVILATPLSHADDANPEITDSSGDAASASGTLDIQAAWFESIADGFRLTIQVAPDTPHPLADDDDGARIYYRADFDASSFADRLFIECYISGAETTGVVRSTDATHDAPVGGIGGIGTTYSTTGGGVGVLCQSAYINGETVDVTGSFDHVTSRFTLTAREEFSPRVTLDSGTQLSNVVVTTWSGPAERTAFIDHRGSAPVDAAGPGAYTI